MLQTNSLNFNNLETEIRHPLKIRELREIKESDVTDLHQSLFNKFIQLANIPDKDRRQDVGIVVDYDCTIILQNSNLETEKIQRTTAMQNILGSIFNGNTTVQRVGAELIASMPQIKQTYQTELSGYQQEQLLNTQYCILNFFNGLLDCMLLNHIKQINLISNSTYYLLFFGIFITADALQIYKRQNDLPNVLMLMYEKNYLTIESCNHVNAVIRKYGAFKQYAQTTGIQYLLSIGDGVDQEISAQQVHKKGFVKAIIVKFDFCSPLSHNLITLLNFHESLFEKLQINSIQEYREKVESECGMEFEPMQVEQSSLQLIPCK